MKDITMTKRIEQIRESYLDALNAQVVPQRLVYEYVRNTTASENGFTSFGFCALRQRLLYIVGWKKYRKIYTTRLRRAYATAYVLEKMAPIIDDHELIVGSPDYNPLTPEEEKLLAKGNKEMDISPPYFGRVDHCSLDFEKLLKLGVNGMIAEIEGLQSKLDPNNKEDIRKDEFYEGCLVELRALCLLQMRFTKLFMKINLQKMPFMI